VDNPVHEITGPRSDQLSKSPNGRGLQYTDEYLRTVIATAIEKDIGTGLLAQALGLHRKTLVNRWHGLDLPVRDKSHRSPECEVRVVLAVEVDVYDESANEPPAPVTGRTSAGDHGEYQIRGITYLAGEVTLQRLYRPVPGQLSAGDIVRPPGELPPGARAGAGGGRADDRRVRRRRREVS